MACVHVAAMQFSAFNLFRPEEPLVMRSRRNARTESEKTRNRRMQKYNGMPKRPRLSVFCSDKQLYDMLVDDQNKRCLFNGSTLQKSMRQDPFCSTSEAAKHVGEELIKACNSIQEISSYDRNGFALHFCWNIWHEAAKHVGEELIKACNDLSIHEISSYDRNGFATGERIQAFEIALSEYSF